MLLKEAPPRRTSCYLTINSEIVKDAIKNTRKAASPSGMEADGCRRIIISSDFGNVGEDFQKSIAEMAKRLCQERSADYLSAFLTCRLIPLDKKPGVR